MINIKIKISVELDESVKDSSRKLKPAAGKSAVEIFVADLPYRYGRKCETPSASARDPRDKPMPEKIWATRNRLFARWFSLEPFVESVCYVRADLAELFVDLGEEVGDAPVRIRADRSRHAVDGVWFSRDDIRGSGFCEYVRADVVGKIRGAVGTAK